MESRPEFPTSWGKFRHAFRVSRVDRPVELVKLSPISSSFGGRSSRLYKKWQGVPKTSWTSRINLRDFQPAGGVGLARETRRQHRLRARQPSVHRREGSLRRVERPGHRPGPTRRVRPPVPQGWRRPGRTCLEMAEIQSRQAVSGSGRARVPRRSGKHHRPG